MKTVDSPWLVRSCQPAALVVPTLSLIFVLDKLTPICGTLYLEILFQLMVGLAQHLVACTGTTLRELYPTLLFSFIFFQIDDSSSLIKNGLEGDWRQILDEEFIIVLLRKKKNPGQN